MADLTVDDRLNALLVLVGDSHATEPEKVAIRTAISRLLHTINNTLERAIKK